MKQYSYAWEKLHSAMLSLVLNGDLKDRLTFAALSIIELDEDQIPESLIEWFENFKIAISRIEDSKLGSTKASIQNMSYDEADKHAEEILYAYDVINRIREGME